jgi:HEAT repeat protein
MTAAARFAPDPLDWALSSNDDETAVEILRGIKRLRTPRAERVARAMRALDRTTSSRVRNAAALALADMRAKQATDSLIALLQHSETKHARGTLLYALEELDARVPLSILVDLMVNDSFEARQEALRFISKGRFSYDEAALHKAVRRLRSLSRSPDHELAEAGRSALESLELQG